jgi:hypothetical protein
LLTNFWAYSNKSSKIVPFQGLILIFLFLIPFTNLPNCSLVRLSKFLADKGLLNSLVNSPEVHAFFTDLLTTYAERFVDSKSLNISRLPLVFGEFYYNLGTMGHCFPNQVIYPCQVQEIIIELNRLYLLNKLGHDKYFTSSPEYGEYTYIDISFDKMIDTCSHEIAHYIQLVK